MAETTTHIGDERWAEFLRDHDELIPCHLLDEADEPLCGASLVIGLGNAHHTGECMERGCERCAACAAIDDYLRRSHREEDDGDV